MHILLVEDDRKLGRLVERMLAEDRHVVEWVEDGETALEYLAVNRELDAVVLDLGLPGMSGLDVARRLRTDGSRVPILVLTARDAVEDRVAGLDAGADDYLVKPFAYAELAARLRAIARRRGEAGRSSPLLAVGPISLDEVTRTAAVGGRPVSLSARELALLECLLRHPDAVMSRDQLLDAAWPMGVAVTLNTVEAYIHHLREKLGDAGSRIETVRGIGYRLRAG
jgi:DNA-binding response OmpR family regulator